MESVWVTMVWVTSGLEVTWNWLGCGKSGSWGSPCGGSCGSPCGGRAVEVASSYSVRVTVDTGRDSVDRDVTRPLNTGITCDSYSVSTLEEKWEKVSGKLRPEIQF